MGQTEYNLERNASRSSYATLLLRPALEFMIAAGTKGEPNEDVDDGAAYQDDYADILVEEAENRYKDILDYRDYEYVDDRWNNDWDDDAPSDDAVATH